jgi:hypothetical protein
LLAGDLPLETVSDPIAKTAILAAVDVAAPFEDPDEKAAVKYFELYGLSALP